MNRVLETMDAVVNRLLSARLTTEAAALSFFVLLAFPAVLILLVSVLNLLGSGEAVLDALTLLEPLLGEEGQTITRQFVEQSSTRMVGVVSVLTLGILVFVTLGSMLQLQETLTTLRGMTLDQPEWRWKHLVTDRLKVVGLMVLAGLLLAGTMVLSGVVTAGVHGLLPVRPGWIGWAVNHGMIFVVCVLLFSLLYQYLPAGRTPWRPLVEGALVSAALFTLGREILWRVLIGGSWMGFYGASAGVLALGLWVYYSSLIFFAGGLLAYRNGS